MQPRKQIPIPRPVSEIVELLPTHPEPKGLAAAVAYYLVHSGRIMSWAPPLILAFGLRPARVAAALAVYFTVSRTEAWKYAVHRFLAFGSSHEVKFFSARRQPYDPKKQYVVAVGPHGVLACPLFNWHCREEFEFKRSGRFRFLDQVAAYLCIAPGMHLYPLHAEATGSRICDAKASTIKGILNQSKGADRPDSVMLVPGGFSEAVHVDYSDRYDVSYLKGRWGFVKIAIEAGIDIIPVYLFGGQDMYKAWAWNRGGRARKAQETGVPMILWWGRFGTNMPFFEKTVCVTMDPFPASQYSLDELGQAHADYCTYLKACFDEYKVLCEKTKHKELIFAGRGSPAPEP